MIGLVTRLATSLFRISMARRVIEMIIITKYLMSFMPRYEVQPLANATASREYKQPSYSYGVSDIFPSARELQDAITRGILEPIGNASETVQQAFKNIDPFILNGMQSGRMQYGAGNSSDSHNVSITVGDINVSVEGGANASAQDIARAAHKEFLDQVQKDASFLFGSRALIGNTM